MHINFKGRTLALTVAATLAACAFAAPASAATVVFNNVIGTWSNPAGANVSYSGNGTKNAKTSWGTSTGYGKSGYTFSSNSPVNAVIGAPGDYGPFTVGTFTHNNWPVQGAAITSIKLAISTNIIIDGVDQGVRTFQYLFSHLETPNDVSGHNGTCANGQKENASINSNGCADRVKVNFLDTSETFNVNGDLYTLDITGFLNGGSPVTDFWTKEKKNNSAQLLANIRFVERITSAVPEPATWAMMIIGFGAVGTMVRGSRRRTALAA
jgi:hypothetical protein